MSWRTYLCDLNGVRLRDISPIARNLVYSSRMNTPASYGFSVPSDDERISTAHTDTYPMLDEGRRTVKAYRNGILRFCGPVWQVNDVGETETATSAVTCYDHMIRLRRRITLMEAATGVGVTSREGVTFTDMDGGQIIRHLLATSNYYKGHTGLEAGKRLYRNVVIASSPRVYYRMDPGSFTAYDQSGNGINGAKKGTPGTLPAGSNGGYVDPNLAVVLDGISTWLEIPTTSVQTNDTFTVEFWIKPSNNTGVTIIYDQGTPNGARITHTNTGLIRLQRGSSTICASSSAVTVGVWTYVTVTKNGATVSIRFNKTDVTGSVTNLTITTPSNTQGIGADRGGAAPYFAGGIDEFAVYMTALSTATRDDHYDAAMGTVDATYGNVFQASNTVSGTIAYNRRDLLSILYELATAYNGFDTEVVPLDRTDGILNRLDVYARLGSDKPAIVFGWQLPPSNLKHVEKLDSMEAVCNDLEGRGQGDISSTQTDSGSITAYGRYEDVDSFGDLSNQSLVTALTTEELSFRVAAKEMVAVVPMTGGNVPVPWDDYWLGDTVRLRVGAKSRGGYTAAFRVYGVDVAVGLEGAETVNAIYLQQ